MFQFQNLDKLAPSNMGKKWNDEEEAALLDELEKDMDITEIAQNHKRTVGAISFRLEDIAYKMHSKEVPMEEITRKTRLTEEQIAETIQKREQAQQQQPNRGAKKERMALQPQPKSKPEESEIAELKNEIVHMKREITELKGSIKELIEMMKAVYEFEDA
jgi:predicted  nucleic acid-binding Zn-ribbon protein